MPAAESSSISGSLTESEPLADQRWLLIERIVATIPFQKSTRLRDLLRYMAEQSIRGLHAELTEQRIGTAVFHKPVRYSPVEDSSVRVQVRQLRLKLHEYFDGEGRGETLVVEIPKGSYTTIFRLRESYAAKPAGESLTPDSIPAVPKKKSRLQIEVALPWGIASCLAVAMLVLLWMRPTAARPPASPPWPLSSVFSNDLETRAIVADTNYGMMRIVSGRSASLDEYLRSNFHAQPRAREMTSRESLLMSYISDSLLTSYADLIVVNTLGNLAGAERSRLMIRSARDLHLRDIRTGNFILVGSPGSNPWVSLFEPRLSFVEREGVVGESNKYFENLHPQPGEKKIYEGLKDTGSAGADYATISLLPTESGHGNVLLIQGLQQESTEAAGLFLADAEQRERLLKAVGAAPGQTVYFEALIRTQNMDGTPDAASIMAVRILH